MDFTFETPINKELILSRFSEEQIMEYYLRIPVKKGLFRSPLRQDKHPTCSFFRNNSGYLIFKDFATGQYLNVFGVVQTLFGCNYHQALRIIANDFGILHDMRLKKNLGKINACPIKIEDKEMACIQVEIQEYTDLELKWWNKYGITIDILQRYYVYSCKHVFLNGQLFAKSQQHCPIFGYYGKRYHGMELWKIYFPKRNKFRFINNWPAKKIQGYDQLPKAGDMVVITKAMKDCMVLSSLGIAACAPNSETLFVSEPVLADLKSRFGKIIVFYDNDRAGLYNMAKIRHQYPDLDYVYIPREYDSKDISDYYKNYGKKSTINLINNYVVGQYGCKGYL